MPSCNIPENDSKERDRQDIATEGIPLVQISPFDGASVYLMPTETTTEEEKVRKFFEKQVSWLMDEDGEDFVVMETFSQFKDALILLDILKKHNVPSVVSFLARRDEPVAISFSKIQIGLDCLMFCLFQAWTLLIYHSLCRAKSVLLVNEHLYSYELEKTPIRRTCNMRVTARHL